jgi:cytochrome b subunit of formate dehydrogenase
MNLRSSRWLVFAIILCAALVLPALTPVTGLAAGTSECLECHDKIDAAKFEASPHAKVQCTGCHFEVTDLSKHESGDIKINPVDCAKCHRDIAVKMSGSVHGSKDVKCGDCHAAIHDMPKKMALTESVTVCSGCHDTPFAGSVHGEAIEKKNEEHAPTCVTCHGAHDVKPLGEPLSAERRRLTVESCRPCHAKEEITNPHGLKSEYVVCYSESYHGKVFNLGYCTNVAGCSDCHTAHDIRSAADPKSSVNPDKLAATCGVPQCHPGANVNFTKYAPHASYSDKGKYPILYWTFIIMSSLLIGVFSFFWLHSILWWQRAFRENREKRAHHATVPPELALQGEVYRRFDLFGIIMHFLMAVSFIGLVFSGLPLKFPNASWAIGLMKIMGGAKAAGLLHRICAVITFTYFALVNAMVIWFLFFKKTGQNVVQKLLGPDSLFPNLQDGKDIAAMFKWFFNAGPKPKFGRWTYWEKFDFLAVYWGMFAIGLTGLMLWFPTWFAKFVPGWLFNVATIMHSDEALLAAGFIFTVHFFNTHLRPEKFPMDLVIFTGKVSRHEMQEERPLQIAVEKEKGTMEKLQTGFMGSGAEFVLQIVGYTALFLGLAAAYFIATGFLGGH